MLDLLRRLRHTAFSRCPAGAEEKRIFVMERLMKFKQPAARLSYKSEAAELCPKIRKSQANGSRKISPAAGLFTLKFLFALGVLLPPAFASLAQTKGRLLQSQTQRTAPPRCEDSFGSFQDDFEKRAQELIKNAESLFEKTRLGGIYFIGQDDLKPVEDIYNPVFTPPTRDWEIFLSSSHHQTVIDLLKPVLMLRPSGVIVTDSLKQAIQFKRNISKIFPEKEFHVFFKGLPPFSKRKIQERLSEGGAFMLVPKDAAKEPDISSAPVYISLARVTEEDRIQEIQDYLNGYKGRDIADVFILTSQKSRKGMSSPSQQNPGAVRRLIEMLRETSLNTEVKSGKKPAADSEEKSAGAAQMLRHIRAYRLKDSEAIEQWFQSFLRPRFIPDGFLEEAKKKPSLGGLGARSKNRWRYSDFSLEERRQIQDLIEGGGEGLSFTPAEQTVLKLRLFTDRPLTWKDVAETLNRTKSYIGWKEDALLKIFLEHRAVPSALQQRIQEITTQKKRPHQGSWFNYNAFSDREKAEIDAAVEAAKTRLDFSEQELYFIDHYIFTERPVSLRSMAQHFSITHSSYLAQRHNRLMRRLTDSKEVPFELRDRILKRSLSLNKEKEMEESAVFNYVNCTQEEKDLIALSLSSLQTQIDWTERDQYLMDHYIFTDRPMRLRKIGKALGGVYHSILWKQAGRIVRNLLESDLVSSEFKALLRRRSGSPGAKRLRTRYSALSPEDKEAATALMEAARETEGYDELSDYIILHNMFTDTPESPRSIEERFGLPPHSVKRRKQRIFHRLRARRDAWPKALQELIPSGAKHRAGYIALSAEQKASVPLMEAAREAEGYDELSDYIILHNIFTDTPESTRSIEERFGLPPQSVKDRKRRIFRRLRARRDAWPKALQELIPSGGGGGN